MSHAYSLLSFKRIGQLPYMDISVKNESTITMISEFRLKQCQEETRHLFNITYSQIGPDCCIDVNKTKKIVPNTDFVEIVCQDLSEILLEQKQILKNFRVDNRSIDSKILDCIKNSLNLRNRNIQIKDLFLRSCEANHFLDILLLIDPKTLKDIRLDCETENLEDFLLSENWENFEGLRVSFRVQKVTFESLEVIKKVFYNSTVFRAISMAFNEKEEHLEGGNFELCNSREILKVKIQDSWTEVFAQRQLEPSKKINFSEFNVTETPWAVLQVLENRITMEMIVEYLSFRDIVSLLKVSRGTRHCIDLLKLTLNPEFSKISIKNTSRTNIRIGYSFENQDDKICVNYKRTEKSCTVNGLVVNRTIYDTICNDLRQNLKFQKSCLEEFHLDFIYEIMTQHLNMYMHHNPERLFFQNFPDRHKQNFHEMERNLENLQANRNHDSISDPLLQPLPFWYNIERALLTLMEQSGPIWE